MSKRKSEGLELRPPSHEEAKSSSVDLMLHSSKSNSSKMLSHVRGTSTMTKEDNDLHAKVVTKEMGLVGCPKCYMYVITSKIEPKCLRCNTAILLDIFRGDD